MPSPAHTPVHPPPPAGPVVPGSRLRPTAVFLALATVVALAAGWPLVARALPDEEGVRAGARLTIGPEGAGRVVLRVRGGGWELSRSASDPDSGYLLSRAGVRVRASRVDLLTTEAAGRLWPGLRDVLRASDADSRLGAPERARTTEGRPGRTGSAEQGGRAGRAFAFAAPGEDFALTVVVLGGRGAEREALRDGYALARSARFEGGAA
ncbi:MULTISPECIES: hypothetical protein [unclassified Streptomyces]|uniref:hypothetical protein n=1 Tax=unclassified Streptomyces TaxID=2593676 RepID=UPI00081D392A|nr:MULTISPECIES: hypothetical protein [unclassified Streptomyces]MYR29520.1 hypothetical protein [Streptomyces sp. SID4945]SCF46540.1 hypothetical protein GA0115257_118524 [Streptomyces sp. LcepLS]